MNFPTLPSSFQDCVAHRGKFWYRLQYFTRIGSRRCVHELKPRAPLKGVITYASAASHCPPYCRRIVGPTASSTLAIPATRCGYARSGSPSRERRDKARDSPWRRRQRQVRILHLILAFEPETRGDFSSWDLQLRSCETQTSIV